MRIINLYASENRLKADNLFGGYAGEDRITALVIHLDRKLRGKYEYYLRFCDDNQFKRGGMTVTEKLDASKGIIIFSLPKSLMVEGLLRIQLVVSEKGRVLFSPTLRGGAYIDKKPEGYVSPHEGEGFLQIYDINEYIGLKRRGETVWDTILRCEQEKDGNG